MFSESYDRQRRYLLRQKEKGLPTRSHLTSTLLIAIKEMTSEKTLPEDIADELIEKMVGILSKKEGMNANYCRKFITEKIKGN